MTPIAGITSEKALTDSPLSPAHFDMGGVKCSTHTIPQLLDEIRFLMDSPAIQPRTLLCLNAHIYNLAQEDGDLRESLNNARIVAADGMGVVWLARLWRTEVAERCNMTEAFRAFFTSTAFRKNEGILIGVSREEARAAATVIERSSTHCRIRKAYSGYLRDEEYDELFRTMASVDLIYVGMGTPRTERICAIARARCPHAIVWGIGAGTIRILAGTMHEAPPFMRRMGLQWLHRLWREPTRLWTRYLFGNPRFIYRILKTARQARRTLAQQSALPRS
ncbi:MAG: WecB/TagA/CpsF family glycosyltransferase [Candidatus Hydrogenedentales bacterium]|jgi:N-acetylglucosaminyldiphosphoundecaprenol N-acetyl-beta-D-mannosaminyltransferase